MSLVSRLTSRFYRVDKPGRYNSHAPEMSTPEFVDIAYLLLIGRNANSRELREKCTSIDDGSETRSRLIYDIVESLEFKKEIRSARDSGTPTSRASRIKLYSGERAPVTRSQIMPS